MVGIVMNQSIFIAVNVISSDKKSLVYLIVGLRLFYGQYEV